MDLVIENGILVQPHGLVKANLGIEDGKITQISLHKIIGEKTFNAAGKLIFPGIIDSHTHFQYLETGEPVTVDDFTIGSTAGLAGGVTAFIDFGVQYKDVMPLTTIKNRIKEAENTSLLNFGFHLITTYTDERYFSQYKDLVEFGVPSFKIFMINIGEGTLNDGQLFQILEAIGKANGLAMVHAENYFVQEILVQRSLSRGENKPINYATTKPAWTEAEAIERISRIAHNANCPLFVVHCSTAEGLDVINFRQGIGYDIFTETCPHYLTLTEDVYQREEAALFIMGPPLRTKFDQDSLWDGIKAGTISVLSSDHCAFTKEAKLSSPYFNKIPYGFMGTEILFPLLYSEGRKRGITPSELSNLMSTNPARLYGLAPEKGTLDVGTDADITILDPKKEVRITLDLMHTNANYTGYEGIEVKGWPDAVIINGELKMEKGEIYAKAGDGNFLKRKPFNKDLVLY
jgi:dihydropyrimidinase